MSDAIPPTPPNDAHLGRPDSPGQQEAAGPLARRLAKRQRGDAEADFRGPSGVPVPVPHRFDPWACRACKAHWRDYVATLDPAVSGREIMRRNLGTMTLLLSGTHLRGDDD